MPRNKFTLHASVWVYTGMAAWRFLTIPKKESKEITERFGAKKQGWGSLPVRVTIGKTKWTTSIFPDKKTETYLLPLKRDIRKKENITDEDTISFSIEIRV